MHVGVLYIICCMNQMSNYVGSAACFVSMHVRLRAHVQAAALCALEQAGLKILDAGWPA